MGKKKSGSGSGMNIPDHISDGFRKIFWVKYIDSVMQIRDPESFLALDPRWKKFSLASSRLTLYGGDDQCYGSGSGTRCLFDP
jgi:hypothetical protein